MFNAADLRAKVAMSLMAFSGSRVEVLGSYRGADGLKVSDVSDLSVGRDSVEFGKVPAMVTVRRALPKSGSRYFTFPPGQGCQSRK